MMRSPLPLPGFVKRKPSSPMMLAAVMAILSFSSITLAASPPSGKGAPKNSEEAADRYKHLETLARGLFYLESMYVDPEKVDEEQVVTNALKGVVEHLDPHTMLMPAKAFEQMTIDTQGKFGGVGIIVSQERGKIIVVSPIEDTPAHIAGVKAGDEIIEIDGQVVNTIKNVDAVDRMRGDPGSVMNIVVVRKDVKDPIKFKLVREIIKVKSVRGQLLEDGTLYARISSFQEKTTEELEALLQKNSPAKLRGMILDLRDNPGGLLDQAISVTDLFIDSGIIVSTVGRDKNKIEREFARKRGTMPSFPIVVLINGGSASASEIVAGALQDHERALLVGTTSFGKGSVQTLLSLPDGSGLKLTVARYYTPKDRSIQAKGIRPDIIVSDKNSVERPDAERRKESDLKGHIESADLSDVAANQGINKAVRTWPEAMQKDIQLVTGFTYLKSYSMFQRHSMSDRE
jgi:carboxyl-terminal processing protease